MSSVLSIGRTARHCARGLLALATLESAALPLAEAQENQLREVSPLHLELVGTPLDLADALLPSMFTAPDGQHFWVWYKQTQIYIAPNEAPNVKQALLQLEALPRQRRGSHCHSAREGLELRVIPHEGALWLLWVEDHVSSCADRRRSFRWARLAHSEMRWNAQWLGLAQALPNDRVPSLDTDGAILRTDGDGRTVRLFPDSTAEQIVQLRYPSGWQNPEELRVLGSSGDTFLVAVQTDHHERTAEFRRDGALVRELPVPASVRDCQALPTAWACEMGSDGDDVIYVPRSEIDGFPTRSAGATHGIIRSLPHDPWLIHLELHGNQLELFASSSSQLRSESLPLGAGSPLSLQVDGRDAWIAWSQRAPHGGSRTLVAQIRATLPALVPHAGD